MQLARRIARVSLIGLAALVPLAATRATAPALTAEAQLRALLAAGSSFTVTVEGTKQGVFKAENPRAGRQGKIPAIAFSYDVKSPRDAASGMASGRRQHSPITFTKAIDASSPQFFQALTTNEILKSVVFEFYGTNPNGEEQVVYVVRLSNATVGEIEQYVGRTGGDAMRAADTTPIEDVSVTFQRIELESTTGKTMAMDDWSKGR
ncbi:MAG TPA: type VI secretion system tube protein TssD [Gemmatimonadaceae bacterium]|nr:type VI secretion system tube protein TssD [Gemmatimonadaceae bacterium]